MNGITRNKLIKTETKRRMLLTLVAFFAYVLVFHIIYFAFGQAMATAAVIPVIIIGLLYGLKAGITASLLSFPVNIIMYELFGKGGLEDMLLKGGGIPGTLNLILIGAVVGYVKDLSSRLRRELNERKKVE